MKSFMISRFLVTLIKKTADHNTPLFKVTASVFSLFQLHSRKIHFLKKAMRLIGVSLKIFQLQSVKILVLKRINTALLKFLMIIRIYWHEMIDSHPFE